ncbi:MAG: DEAD/DEAH box helicase [Myxococcales bacterium]|nr:DEAD/DEAH box helicase [Myxococcales bacterium]
MLPAPVRSSAPGAAVSFRARTPLGPAAHARASPTMTDTLTFADLGLAPGLLAALQRLEHTEPTPIQVRTIPLLLAGRDVLGQAQTGTGKTAAFALPLLQALDLDDPAVQALVLAPTRELALQVAEAIKGYSQELGNVGVLAIFGGEPIGSQLFRLRGAIRVVVGTPGRVLDHLARGSLRLDKVKVAVLDEADEMLRMGFVADVDSILAQTPATRQTTLFSATLSGDVARVAERHLRTPETVAVAMATRTVATTIQRFVVVPSHHRADALARLLAVQTFDAALVFARTRADCAELSDWLNGNGVAADAMHGDLAQSARLQVVRRLKEGQVRVVIATDVAARGLDVEHIDLVVNMEWPQDAETYVHRIGRTGRAGRSGHSVLFVAPRDEWRLRQLERFTGQRMEQAWVPSDRDLAAVWEARFATAVDAALGADLDAFQGVVAGLVRGGRSLDAIAAALCKLAWGDRPPPLAAEPVVTDTRPAPAASAPAGPLPAGVPGSDSEPTRSTPAAQPRAPARAPVRERPPAPPPPPPRVWLSLGVGARNGVVPQEIADVFRCELDVPAAAIFAIDIRGNHSLVQVPADVVPRALDGLRGIRVQGRYLNVRLDGPSGAPTAPEAHGPGPDRGPERGPDRGAPIREPRLRPPHRTGLRGK